MKSALTAFLIIFLDIVICYPAIGPGTQEEATPELLNRIQSLTENVKPPNIVYVVSGVPLIDSVDTTGGYGDVAANYFAALELKRLLPKTQVVLIVTTVERLHPNVALSRDIIQLLAPDTSIEKTNMIQNHKGIGIFYLAGNDALADKSIKAAESILPRADLVVQYSLNSGLVSTQFSRLNAMLGEASFHFYELSSYTNLSGFSKPEAFYSEPRPSSRILDLPKAASHHASPHMSLRSGPGFGGMYLTNHDHSENEYQILSWLSAQKIVSKNLRTLSDFPFAVVYSKNPIALKNYAQFYDRLGIRQPSMKTNLLLPESASLAEFRGLKNIVIHPYNTIPGTVMKALIQNATRPSLVKGDSSFSHAISERSGLFFQEKYPWKDQLYQDLRTELMKPVEKNYRDQLAQFIDLGFDFGTRVFSSAEIDFLVSAYLDDSFQHEWLNVKSKFSIRNNLFKRTLDIYKLSRAVESLSQGDAHSVVRTVIQRLDQGEEFHQAFQAREAPKCRNFVQ